MDLQNEMHDAREEIQRLRGQLQEERKDQGTEMERLKTMQTLIEQQRLQLLQTENQMSVRAIEDIDMLVTTQATLNSGGGGQMDAYGGGGCGGGMAMGGGGGGPADFGAYG